MDRRTFAKVAAGAVAGPPVAAQQEFVWPASKKMIGIQVGAVSFIDEGVDPVLDNFERLAKRQHALRRDLHVRARHRWASGPRPTAARPWQAGIRHGVPRRNLCCNPPGIYANTVLKDFRAPDHGDFDVLATVVPAAKKRGMKVICWYEDVWRADVPNVSRLAEKDLQGRVAGTMCMNNPDHLGFLVGLTQDYVKSYDVDGIMWGSERQGAFSNALGASHGGGRNDPTRVTCFCEHCRNKGRERGINFDRVKEGYAELAKFVQASRGGTRPVDGYYVAMWRLMLRYPELLAWEMLWTDSLRDVYKAIYTAAKQAKPSVGVGWHIWHNNSFNPIYRAEQDLQAIAPVSDFLKIVMYHNCGGERLASYIGSVGKTIYGDVPSQDLLDFHYRVMDYHREKTIDEIPKTGLSSEYVLSETKRARAGPSARRPYYGPAST